MVVTLAPSSVRPPASVPRLAKGVLPPTAALKATSPWLLTDKACAPSTVPAKLSAPVPVVPTVVSAAKFTAPLAVAALALLLINAPAAPMPEPLKLRALARLCPAKSSVAPLATVTLAVPKGPEVTAPLDDAPACSVPALTVVPPE